MLTAHSSMQTYGSSSRMTDGTRVRCRQHSKSDIEEFTGHSSENIDMGVINAWQAASCLSPKSSRGFSLTTIVQALFQVNAFQQGSGR